MKLTNTWKHWGVMLAVGIAAWAFAYIGKAQGEEVLAKHFFRLIKKSMPKYADALYSVEINNYNGYIVTVLKEDETEDETWESNCVGGFES